MTLIDKPYYGPQLSGFLDYIILSFWSIYLILIPFCFLASGGPQVADLFAILSMIFITLSMVLKNRITFDAEMLFTCILLCLFVFYSFIVSSVWFVLLGDSKVLNFPIFYFYNSMLFIFVAIAYNSYRVFFLKTTCFAILLSVAIQVALSPFSIIQTEFRQSLFFNNPNQLGYYSVLFLVCYVMLAKTIRLNAFIQCVGIVMCVYLSLLSLSKAANSATLVFLITLFLKKPSLIIASIAIALFFFVVFDSSTFLNKIEQRATSIGADRDDNLGGRGYDRLANHPEYLIFGAGEGAFYRFRSAIGGEIHSTFGTIVFSYGIIGCGIFIITICKILMISKFRGILYILPPIIYGMTHHGLRFSSFWILLALVAIIGLHERGLYEEAPLE